MKLFTWSLPGKARNLIAALSVMFSFQASGQTIFDVLTFDSQNLDGSPTLLICPGQSYLVTFSVTSGQINPFANVQVKMKTTGGPPNPSVDITVGTFSNGATAIAGPSAPIPALITIPLAQPTGFYRFYIFAPPLSITPAPSTSDSLQREVIVNPKIGLIIDTTRGDYDNIFRTDSLVRLLSVFPNGVPTPNGVGPIPPFAQPVPDRRDSTINFCAGDSILLFNPDSNLADEHRWFINNQQIPGLSPLKGSIWVTISGYYSLAVVKANTCRDSTAYIGLGHGGSFALGLKGLYFNAYEIDTSVERTGPGNAIGSPIRFCPGDSAILTGRETSSHPQGSYRYWWTKDGTDTVSTQNELVVFEQAVYKLWIEESIGPDFTCKREGSSIFVIVDPKPPVSVAPIPSIQCFGDTLDLADQVPYNKKRLYEWRVNNLPLFPIFGDTNRILVDTATLGGLGFDATSVLSFTLTVTDTTGCDSTSAPINISFVEYPDIILSTGDSIKLCPGDSTQAFAGTANGISASFRWFTSTGLLYEVGAAAWFNAPGKFVIEATGPNSCVSYDTVYVVNLPATANAGPDQTIQPGEEVQLTGSGGVSYFWYADSPVFFSNPFSASPTTRPSRDTTAYVLEVTAANGCKDIDTMFVFVVRSSAELFNTLQNVITPNGDGINDVLDLSGFIGADACEFVVLNRWGKEVYNATVYQNDWKGTDNGGNALPDGTYYYLVKCGDETRLTAPLTIFNQQ